VAEGIASATTQNCLQPQEELFYEEKNIRSIAHNATNRAVIVVVSNGEQLLE
jgi:hypothetical protein